MFYNFSKVPYNIVWLVYACKEKFSDKPLWVIILRVLSIESELLVGNLYHAIFVQIILESLPVSSSGHIKLLEHYMHISYAQEFIYWLHIPTVLIFLLFFYHQSVSLIKRLVKGEKNALYTAVFVMIADSVTILLYGLLSGYKKGHAFHSYFLPFGFFVTLCVLYSLRWRTTRRLSNDTLTGVNALVCGLAQGVALLPGVSRFACVYTAQMWLGFSPAHAFFMTWLLQMPLIAAAVAKVMISQHTVSLSGTSLPHMVCAVGAATALSYYALRKSYEWACKDTLYACAYYMIIPLAAAVFYLNYYT